MEITQGESLTYYNMYSCISFAFIFHLFSNDYAKASLFLEPYFCFCDQPLPLQNYFVQLENAYLKRTLYNVSLRYIKTPTKKLFLSLELCLHSGWGDSKKNKTKKIS